ncbi:MAG: hypothetical protein JXR03_17140 [Cyclobacteriaceae bacterium]
MIRTFILILTILFLAGCGERTIDSEILAFENQLGKKEAVGLSKMVEHFETELLKKHPNKTLDEAYQIHLDFIANSNGSELGNRVLAQFRKDSIFGIYSKSLVSEIWIKPDSVWINDSLLYISYRGNLNPRGRKINYDITDFDSLLYTEKNTEAFNIKGRYLLAFKEISESNVLANWYYDLHSNAGTFSPHITAQAFQHRKFEYYNLRTKIDYSDYLVKRIILVETYADGYFNKVNNE